MLVSVSAEYLFPSDTVYFDDQAYEVMYVKRKQHRTHIKIKNKQTETERRVLMLNKDFVKMKVKGRK